jgi:hypothetical protein
MLSLGITLILWVAIKRSRAGKNLDSIKAKQSLVTFIWYQILYHIGRYAWNEEAYVLGLRDFIRGLKIRKADPLNSYKISYEKSKCHVCGQICYNKGDLDLHLKYNHPDVASTQPT